MLETQLQAAKKGADIEPQREQISNFVGTSRFRESIGELRESE